MKWIYISRRKEEKEKKNRNKEMKNNAASMCRQTNPFSGRSHWLFIAIMTHNQRLTKQNTQSCPNVVHLIPPITKVTAIHQLSSETNKLKRVSALHVLPLWLVNSSPHFSITIWSTKKQNLLDSWFYFRFDLTITLINACSRMSERSFKSIKPIPRKQLSKSFRQMTTNKILIDSYVCRWTQN